MKTKSRYFNKSLITRLIYNQPGISRAHLAKKMGLTLPAISKIVNDLEEAGLVEEMGFVSGKKGRRAIGLKLCSDDYYVAGIKFSRRSIKAAIYDLAGKAVDFSETKINKLFSEKEIIDKIKSIIDENLNKDYKIRCIAIAVPGPFNNKKKQIRFMTGMEDFFRFGSNPFA